MEEPRTELIETIVLSVDDLIEALHFKNQPEALKDQTTVSIKITPLTTVAEASVDYQQKGNFYPPKMSIPPIHLDPARFTEGQEMEYPLRNSERDRAKKDLDNPSDEEIEEYIQTAFDVWEDDVRRRLADKLQEPRHDSKHDCKYLADTVLIEWKDT